MIRLEMVAAWFISFLLGIALLVSLSVVDFVISLFELPFDTWEIVKEKYQQVE